MSGFMEMETLPVQAIEIRGGEVRAWWGLGDSGGDSREAALGSSELDSTPNPDQASKTTKEEPDEAQKPARRHPHGADDRRRHPRQ